MTECNLDYRILSAYWMHQLQQTADFNREVFAGRLMFYDRSGSLIKEHLFHTWIKQALAFDNRLYILLKSLSPYIEKPQQNVAVYSLLNGELLFRSQANSLLDLI